MFKSKRKCNRKDKRRTEKSCDCCRCMLVHLFPLWTNLRDSFKTARPSENVISVTACKSGFIHQGALGWQGALCGPLVKHSKVQHGLSFCSGETAGAARCPEVLLSYLNLEIIYTQSRKEALVSSDGQVWRFKWWKVCLDLNWNSLYQSVTLLQCQMLWHGDFLKNIINVLKTEDKMGTQLIDPAAARLCCKVCVHMVRNV